MNCCRPVLPVYFVFVHSGNITLQLATITTTSCYSTAQPVRGVTHTQRPSRQAGCRCLPFLPILAFISVSHRVRHSHFSVRVDIDSFWITRSSRALAARQQRFALKNRTLRTICTRWDVNPRLWLPAARDKIRSLLYRGRRPLNILNIIIPLLDCSKWYRGKLDQGITTALEELFYKAMQGHWWD